jgi:tRNA (guanine-N7-)-methyltransferase
VAKKGKLAKFAEIKTFNNVLEPRFDEVLNKDYKLKGKWAKDFFRNDNKITLELGCGKGEYTIGQAKLFPERNFIGIDIKGARLWRGVIEASENNLHNVAFIRTRVDFVNSFFDKNEVEEIWITFPDPQSRKVYKRLTSARFLNRYCKFIVNNATLNLKTDSVELYTYTKSLAEFNSLKIQHAVNDVYNSALVNDKILSIKTFYEQGWLKEGLRSHYLQFNLNSDMQIEELPDGE